MITDSEQVGWTLPFVWAGIWAIITTIWVKISLKDEYRHWAEDRAKERASAP
jgi:hypothetical protein